MATHFIYLLTRTDPDIDYDENRAVVVIAESELWARTIAYWRHASEDKKLWFESTTTARCIGIADVREPTGIVLRDNVGA